MIAGATINGMTGNRRFLDLRRPRRQVRPSTETAMPFDVAGVAWAGTPSVPTVTLVEGDIEIHGETLAGTTTTYKTVSPLTVTLTGSGTEYVYAQVTWSGSAWGTPTLAKGASKPNDAADTYRKLLWKFVDGVPMVQYHRGNIEAVGLRMQA